MAEGMDPEELHDLIDELLGRFRAVVERHGGRVDKFIGDAAMAVFGVPAHEDDALRAVRAALAMQEEVAAFGREKGRELKIRVGINSGEVLWGSTGGGQATVTGDAVNVAQRLEALCEAGKVTVSGAVREAAGERMRFRALGLVSVKGREEKVEAWEATGEGGPSLPIGR